jgi:TfoX/Sxy family transcriptional regulator of competence genes
MAFDEDLADRIRRRLGRVGVEEKRMFGGLAFLVGGHLAVAVRDDSILARLGPAPAEEALREPHVTQFVNGDRAMRGWVVIDREAVEADEELDSWIDRATAFVETLPVK